MKFIKKIIFIPIFSALVISCGKKEEGIKENQEVKTETKNQQTAEQEPSVATITEEQMKAVGITLGTIETKELTSTIKANGLLNVPNNSKATVTSLYGGVIKTLNIQVGNYVRKGQVIATISNPEYIQLQEQYLTVNSKITFAEQEYRRQKELFDNDAGAKKNLQSSDAELKSLRAQKASLQRQLQLMGISPANVSYGNLRSGLVIKSPINGTISNIMAQIGSYIDISAPLAEIVDNSSLHLDLQVFEKDLPKMKVGQIVHFKLTNNPEIEYKAKVFSIGASFENESKTISVHCTVIGNKTGLIDGMNITGTVSLDKSATTAIPDEAIVEADGKFFIFALTDKKAEENHDEEAENNETKKTETTENHQSKTLNFEKIEVVKGTSDMGFTAITPVSEVKPNAKIAIKGAFFINAKLKSSGEHGH